MSMLGFVVALVALQQVPVPSPTGQGLPPQVSDTSPFRRLGLPTPTLLREGSGTPGPRYWQQRADYTIRATLDTATHTIAGSPSRRSYASRCRAWPGSCSRRAAASNAVPECLTPRGSAWASGARAAGRATCHSLGAADLVRSERGRGPAAARRARRRIRASTSPQGWGEVCLASWRYPPATPATTIVSPSQPRRDRCWWNKSNASTVPTTGSIVAATAAGAASMRFTAEKKNRLAASTDPAVRATRPRQAASDGGGVGARPASVSTMPRITTPPIASRNSTGTAP